MAGRTAEQERLFEEARSRALREGANTTKGKGTKGESNRKKKEPIPDSRSWLQRLYEGLGGKG